MWIEENQALANRCDLESSLGEPLSRVIKNKEDIVKGIFFKQKRIFLEKRGSAFPSLQEGFFDQIMTYFDVWQPFKKAYQILWDQSLYNFDVGCISLNHHREIIDLMLDIYDQHFSKSFKVQFLPQFFQKEIVRCGLYGVFIAVLPTFLGDRTGDQSTTMAKLDQLLSGFFTKIVKKNHSFLSTFS